MITQKQVEVLKAIIDYINNKGFSPTIREIGESVGLQSTSTVHKYIEDLEKLGCINRVATSPRAMSVTDEGLKMLNLMK